LAACLRHGGHTSRTERIKKRARLRASAGKLVLSRHALVFSLLAMIGLMCFSYVALINTRVTKGFEIKALEQRLAELQKGQKQLQQQAAELQSIQNIEQKLDLSGFIPTTNVTYLRSGDYALAERQSDTP